MKKIPNFDQFVNEAMLIEGAIPVYGKGNVYKKAATLRVVDVIRDFTKWLAAEETFSVIVDTEGVPEAGTKEGEFDVVGIEGDKIKVAGKKGNEFLIKAGKVLEVQKGNSVVDGIAMGASYLVDGKMRAKIVDYNNGIVQIKLQNGENREYTLKEWKAANLTPLDDSLQIRQRGSISESATDAEMTRIQDTIDKATEVTASQMKEGEDYFTKRPIGAIGEYSKVLVSRLRAEGDEIIAELKLGKEKETIRLDKNDTETGLVAPTDKMEFGANA